MKKRVLGILFCIIVLILAIIFITQPSTPDTPKIEEQDNSKVGKGVAQIQDSLTMTFYVNEEDEQEEQLE